jgi:hypothetical protein
LTDALPRAVVPSRKLTVPVGTPEPGALADTVAVSVSCSPNTTEVDDSPRLVVVASWATVSVRAGALLATKLGPPEYDAVTG